MSEQTDGQNSPRVEFQVHFQTGHRGRRSLRKGASSKVPKRLNEHLPRLTRLLALAHRWNRLMDKGVATSYTEIASLMGLSRARITQIMDLLYLAPTIQEEVIPDTCNPLSKIPASERAVRQITRIPNWSEQCKLWRNLREAEFPQFDPKR